MSGGYVVNVSFPEINLALSPSAESASVARRSLGKLGGLVSAERMEDLRLVVTELVTNSVLHASLGSGDEILLEIRVSPGVIRGSVTDPGPGFEKPSGERPVRLLEDTDPSGWGLYVVGGIVDRWGGGARRPHARVVRGRGPGLWRLRRTLAPGKSPGEPRIRDVPLATILLI